MVAEMKAHRMETLMDVSLETTEDCLGKTEARIEAGQEQM
jgi:hypothetical protein